jgi:hypothetical protein
VPAVPAAEQPASRSPAANNEIADSGPDMTVCLLVELMVAGSRDLDLSG